MDRRGVFRGATTVLAGVLGALAIGRTAQGGGQLNPGMKVVYHLVDYEKVDFVLGNIRHHYEGVGDANPLTIALIAHGPALRGFAPGASAATLERLAALQRKGLTAHACGNTLRGMKLELKDLAPGFILAETGGVVRLAELQRDGYFYLRP